MKNKRIHPAWTAAGVTFLTLVATAGFRSAPSVLIIPLQQAFRWNREQISLAISVNVLLFGLTAPFAATLIERFSLRRVVTFALLIVSLGTFLTTKMTAGWQLYVLWGLFVGFGTGCLALVFGAELQPAQVRPGLHPRGVAVLAARGHLVTARDRVPGRLRPLNCAVVGQGGYSFGFANLSPGVVFGGAGL